MNTRHSTFLLLLFLLIAITLTACSSNNTDFIKPSTPTAPSDDVNLGVKIQWWLTQVAWSAATVPIIGPLIVGILGEISPENHWVVGGALILIILGAISGGGSSQR